MKFLLVQLCACRDVVIDHQQVQAFFAFLRVDSGDQHAAGVDAHHLAWWEVDNSDAGLADQLLRLIVVVDAAEEGEERLHLLMVDDHIPAGAKLY